MRSRLISAVFVLATAFVAACLGLMPELSTTAQEAVVVLPGSADFGSVPVGGSSMPITFTVSPASGSGDSDDTITSIVGCSGFAINAPGVPGAQVFRHCGGGPGTASGTNQTFQASGVPVCDSPVIQNYNFTVTFNPIVGGLSSCNIVVNLAGGGTQTVIARGTGVLPDFDIDVRPGALNFGEIRTATPSSPLEATVANVGGKELTIASIKVVGPGSAAYEITGGNPNTHVLPSGAAEKVQLVCTPSAIADFAAVLEVTSNDPVTPTARVSLSCKGINSNLDIQPTAFPAVDTRVFVETTSQVTLRNDGNTSGTIDSIALKTTNPAVTVMSKPADGTTLAPNQSAQVVVRYAPTQPEPSAELGSIEVSFDGTVRTIPIQGEALLAKVASQPMELDFGPVCAGRVTTQEVEVYAELEGSYELLGASAQAPFSVTPTTLQQPFPMLPTRLNEFPFQVSVNPPAEGEVTGMVTVTTETSYVIPTRATALPPGITALPASLDYGVIEAGLFTSAQTVTFTNCGDTPIQITGERIEGTHASEFALTRTFQVVTVAPAETVEIDVLMAPRTLGPKDAQLVIEYTGGATMVALIGQAFDLDGDGDSEGGEQTTYYACSAGGTAGWPLALALGVLVLRRRRRRA